MWLIEVGIVQFYAGQAGLDTVPVRNLERAIGGDRVYWAPAFRGATLLQGIPTVPKSVIDMRRLDERRATTFDRRMARRLADARS